MGRDMFQRIVRWTRTDVGFAHLADVRTKEQDDAMEREVFEPLGIRNILPGKTPPKSPGKRCTFWPHSGCHRRRTTTARSTS